MPRLLPSIEVRPLAGVVLYALIALIALGVIFGSAGGAAVWALFWIVVALAVYAVVSKGWGSLT